MAVPYNGVATEKVDPDAPAVYYRPDVNAGTFGAGIGHALQGLGGQIAQAGDDLSSVFGKVQSDDAKNGAQEALGKLLHGDPDVTTPGPDGTPTPQLGFMQTSGRNTLDQWKAAHQRVDAIIKAGRSKLTDPGAQREYDHWAGQYRQHVLNQIGAHAGGQARVYANEVNNASGNVALQHIANNADNDEEFLHGLEDRRSAAVKNAEINGLGDVGVRDAINQATAAAWKTRVDAISVKDPLRAYRMAEEHKNELGTIYDQVSGQLRARAETQEGIAFTRQQIAAEQARANAAPPSAFDEASIIDLSSSAQAPWATKFAGPAKGIIIHHTGGHGDAKSVVDVLNQRGLGTQYVVDRDGKVHRTLPEGHSGRQIRIGQGRGAGLSNENTIGIEFVGADDRDITQAQIETARKFVPWLQQKYGVPAGAVFGHGEVNPHKQETEGHTIVAALRGGNAGGTTAMLEYDGGPSESYAERVARIESNGGQASANIYQFKGATAARYGVNATTSPAEQRAALDRLTGDNLAYLRSRGVKINDVALYMAHQQGARGAEKLMKAADSAIAAEIVGAPNAQGNRPFFYKKDGTPLTVAESKIVFARKMGVGATELERAGIAPIGAAGQQAFAPTAQGFVPQPTTPPAPPEPEYFDVTPFQAPPPPPAPPSLEEMQANVFRSIESSGLSDGAKNHAYAEASRAYNAIAQQAAGLSSQVQQALKQIQDGYQIPQETWNKLGQEVHARGTGDIRAKYDTVSAVRDDFETLKGMPPQAVAAYVRKREEAAGQSLSPKDHILAEAGQKYLARLAQDIKADPITRAARDGVVTGVQPLAFGGSREEFAESLAARLPQAERVAQFYRQPVRYLMPGEQQVLQQVATAGGDTLINVAAAVIDKLGPQSGAFFEEIGESAPEFAHMGRLMLLGAGPMTLSDLAEYQSLSQDKEASKYLPKLEEGTVQTNARDAYKDAFRAMGPFGLSAIDSARKLIEIRSMRSGTAPKDISTKAVMRAFQEAAGARFEGDEQYGGVASYTGTFNWWWKKQSIPVPQSIRANNISDVINAIRNEDLADNPPLAEDDSPLKIARIQQNGNLIAIGHGRYTIALNDPYGSDPQWIFDRSGKPYILDLNQLEPVLRKRVPYAYREEPELSR